MAKLVIRVNGRRQVVKAARDTPLLYVLRNELELRGPRFGCGLAQCGACTVHLGRQADPLVRHAGRGGARQADHDARGARHAPRSRTRAEGVHRAPGRAVRLLHERDDHGRRRLPEAATRGPTRGEIKQAMTPYLCRCGTHFRIVAAIKAARRRRCRREATSDAKILAGTAA